MKIYEVTYTHTTIVAAESEREAEKWLESNISNVVRGEMGGGAAAVKHELTTPGDYSGCLPWNGDGDLTVNDLLKEGAK